jgi:DNA-binding transcriptional MerR regulator
VEINLRRSDYSLEDIFSIKQISEQIGLSEDTLRYYEKIGLIPKVNRNNLGYRVYSLENKDLLTTILCLKYIGMTLDQIKLYTKIDSISERYEMLLRYKEKMQDQMAELQKFMEKKLKFMRERGL